MASATIGSACRHLRHLFGGGSTLGMGDAQLLERYASSRDGAAFEALVGRHGPMVWATCRAVLKNPHDAEDAFQATFLALARKAGSVRGEALGGWLHRVAYRASVRLAERSRRRRREESEASAMATLVASPPGPEPDLRPILHEEVDRLPQGQRLPVVLCDLEGLSYEQAAGQLGWTVPTLRCRLARGRQRLRDRLTRRGITAPAMAALLAASAASASVVPPALARQAVAAACGGAASAGVLALTQSILRGMLMTRIKLACSAAMAALGLATAGVIAAGAGRPDDPKPETNAAVPPRAVAEAAPPEGSKPEETVEVRGRVVAPDGKPVAGASVRVTYVYRDDWPGATTGPDGRFAIRLPRPDATTPPGYLALYPWLVASAPGFGLGWAQGVLRPGRPDEQEVRLVEEGPPIEGRIVDLEGRPVSGATVKAAHIWFDEKGDLPTWIAKARINGAGNLWQGLQQLPLEKLVPIEARAGADGRFRLTGIGRDRIADLIVSGPKVATTQVNVFSRPEVEIRTTDRGMMRIEPFIVHAPQFQLALAPSKRVEGTARDKDTGKPIAGLKITAAVFDERSMIPARGVEATTDAEGRYALDGLPKATAYRLFLKPGKGMPYTTASLEAPADSPALEPVAFDFALKRGVVIRGKVTGKGTGRPVLGYASYNAFLDNPHVSEFPGFNRGYEQVAMFDEEGRYVLVALPGRGLITVRDEENRHLPARGYERIGGYDPQLEGFRTVPTPVPARGVNVIAEVDADPKAESLTIDLQADPGRSVSIEVVGPDGSPSAGPR